MGSEERRLSLLFRNINWAPAASPSLLLSSQRAPTNESEPTSRRFLPPLSPEPSNALAAAEEKEDG